MSRGYGATWDQTDKVSELEQMSPESFWMIVHLIFLPAYSTVSVVNW
jgi:hypothetical protein